MVHDRHAPAELVGLFHVMRHEDDRLSVPVQVTQQVPQRQSALGIESRRRLVHEQHRRAMEDRAGDHESLRHSSRQCVHGGLRPLRKLESLEQLVGHPPRAGCPHSEQPAVEIEVFKDRELAVERVRLGDDADDLFRERRVGNDVDAADEGAPRGRDHPRRQHPGGRRLPGPVRTEQPEDLAPFDGEVQFIDGFEVRPGVDLRELDRFDDRVRHPLGSRRAVDAHEAAIPSARSTVVSIVAPLFKAELLDDARRSELIGGGRDAGDGVGRTTHFDAAHRRTHGGLRVGLRAADRAEHRADVVKDVDVAPPGELVGRRPPGTVDRIVVVPRPHLLGDERQERREQAQLDVEREPRACSEQTGRRPRRRRGPSRVRGNRRRRSKRTARPPQGPARARTSPGIPSPP